MPESLSVKKFLASEEATSLRAELERMVKSPLFNTKSTYSPASLDSDLLFVDKHMTYLSKHPTTNPQQYLSNLRLMTRLR